MHRDKSSKGVKALTRIERSFFIRADSDAGVARIRHGNRKRNKPWPRFHITNRETNVFTPNVDDRSSSAIVARVHAEIIFLTESRSQWQDPIRALLVRATLIGPERRTLSRGK